jgi:hypothetical protein
MNQNFKLLSQPWQSQEPGMCSGVEPQQQVEMPIPTLGISISITHRISFLLMTRY